MHTWLWLLICSGSDRPAQVRPPRVIAVPAHSTSQEWSGCGERLPKSLSVRTPVCTSCGLVVDRDEHAARTIQWAGRARRGLAG